MPLPIADERVGRELVPMIRHGLRCAADQVPSVLRVRQGLKRDPGPDARQSIFRKNTMERRHPPGGLPTEHPLTNILRDRRDRRGRSRFRPDHLDQGPMLIMVSLVEDPLRPQFLPDHPVDGGTLLPIIGRVDPKPPARSERPDQPRYELGAPILEQRLGRVHQRKDRDHHIVPALAVILDLFGGRVDPRNSDRVPMRPVSPELSPGVHHRQRRSGFDHGSGGPERR